MIEKILKILVLAVFVTLTIIVFVGIYKTNTEPLEDTLRRDGIPVQYIVEGYYWTQVECVPLEVKQVEHRSSVNRVGISVVSFDYTIISTESKIYYQRGHHVIKDGLYLVGEGYWYLGLQDCDYVGFSALAEGPFGNCPEIQVIP